MSTRLLLECRSMTEELQPFLLSIATTAVDVVSKNDKSLQIFSYTMALKGNHAYRTHTKVALNCCRET